MPDLKYRAELIDPGNHNQERPGKVTVTETAASDSIQESKA